MNHLRELIIRDAFHQQFPLRLDKFIDYCKKRDLAINKKILEDLDKMGVFKPIMRIRGNYVYNTTDLKEMCRQKFVDDPHLVDFIPWDNFYEYKDNLKEDIIHVYYHPYQIYFLNEILHIKMIVRPFDFRQDDDDLLKNIRRNEELLKKRLDALIQDVKHDQFVKLLIFIQNKYLPHVKQPGYVITTNTHYPINDYKEWTELQKNIVPEEIIKTLGIEEEEIKKYRKYLGYRGLTIDPMEHWYDLIKYIGYNKRKRLKGDALLAQDFYIMSDMLRLFLEDLTVNKQLETRIIFDSGKGQGHVRNYGKELNYIDRDVLIKILREFGINPKPKLVLIVEGDTEEKAIPIIANSMDIPLDRFGIEIINIRSIDKSPQEYLIHLSTPDIYQIEKESYIHPERTKIFILLDNEGGKKNWFRNPPESIEKMMSEVLSIIGKKINKTVTTENPVRVAIEEAIEKGIEESIEEGTIEAIKKDIKEATKEDTIETIFRDKTVKYQLCDKCFEYDNFSNEELSRELNTYAEKYSCNFTVTPDEIVECRKDNKNLKKFIEKKTNGATSLYKDKLGCQLANMVADEIKNRENKFDNQRPIEKTLDDIVRFVMENP